MATLDVLPSDVVNANFSNCQFGNVETEAILHQIVAYLAKYCDEWEYWISISDFIKFTEQYDKVPYMLYFAPFSQFQWQNCDKAWQKLVTGEYIMYDLNQKVFMVTNKLIAFYQQYKR